MKAKKLYILEAALQMWIVGSERSGEQRSLDRGGGGYWGIWWRNFSGIEQAASLQCCTLFITAKTAIKDTCL